MIKTCIEPGCAEPAGTPWSPHWCPSHDEERRNNVLEDLRGLLDEMRRRERGVR